MINPRLINRKEAAQYLGVSPNTFDTYVRLGKFPKPMRLGKRKVWDLHKIDSVLDRMSGLESRDEIKGPTNSEIIKENLRKYKIREAQKCNRRK